MFTFEKNKFVLSLAILALATLSVWYPALIFITIGAIILVIFALRSPTVGITTALLAATFGEFGRIEFGEISFLILDLVAPIVLAIWFFRKLADKEKIPLDWLSGSLFAFWAVGILSLLFGFTELSTAEFKFALLHFLRFVGISGMLLVARDLGKKEAHLVLNVTILSGVILALAGFALLHLLPDFTEAGLTELGWDPHIGRLTSTFLDPNFAGGVFAFLLAILGGRFLQERKLNRQILFSGLAGILGIALFLTFSRSALLAVGIAGLVLGIFGDRRIFIGILVLGILGVTTSGRLQERLGEFTKSVGSISDESQQVLDDTAQLRVDSWRESWQIFAEKPILGIGFGAYKFHQNFSGEDSHAANGSDASLLNVAATTGILGLGVFGIFLWNLALISWRKKEWGFLAALAGLLVHSIFVNSLFFAPIALLLFTIGGTAATKSPQK
ncbi:O-antigen ligase family protein [Candidatus Gracilibacteria bacterium]|nr:O-antigen ligase family protein [Candidatus Gracilibacteria bacterium]MCF7856440.1 O-antigen ligase family protein [Candidatus Gracilibacteria bacterium]MCF7896565.1 O-antigen ligase family protein [Candidatus Gracilibacteria bacterium]